MNLASTHTSAVVARRQRLSERLGASVALFAASRAPSRNYPATTYAFRAGSHFLYFVGLPVADSFLLIEDGEAMLFVPAPDPADELWHGPTPSLAAIAEATGCRVRPREELSTAITRRNVATIAAVDLATRLEQERLLGRSLSAPSAADEELMDAVIALRLCHDGAALAELRAAAEVTALAHRAGMAATRVGILEAVVRAAMEAECTARGVGVAYTSIVTVHGEVLHNDSSPHRMSDSDLLLCDVGAESSGGWASDVTRTWPVNGSFSSTQREMYDVVLAAQKAAISAVRPGARYRDVHLLAARVLAEGLIALGVLHGDPQELVADGVHALLFPHGVGHLLGLDVHDMEDLGDRAGYAKGRTRSEQFGLSYLRLDRDLQPGMAVTIEPGLYRVPAILNDPKLSAIAKDRLDRACLDRFSDVRGIRIEDDVLVTEDEPEVLTSAIPKEADDVEAVIG